MHAAVGPGSLCAGVPLSHPSTKHPPRLSKPALHQLNAKRSAPQTLNGDEVIEYACLPVGEDTWSFKPSQSEPETPKLKPVVPATPAPLTFAPGPALDEPPADFDYDPTFGTVVTEEAPAPTASTSGITARERRRLDAFDEDGDSHRGGPKNKLPAEVRCFDRASICVKAGDGGNGCVSFRREKFVPRGGPNGGDGGDGGSVWAEVDISLNSLMFFRHKVHHRAPNGKAGEGKNMVGAGASDIVIKVPPGTVFRQRDAPREDPPVAELLLPGDRALLCLGGRGGRGNAAFKTARNNVPQLAEQGEAAPEVWMDVELNLVADVGIIGVPNAGKSTLLSVVSAAKPKIANYPFTTLAPNLGVCEMDYRSTVFADVPGLLEGAHTGLGLGHEFLRHCQRCRVLIHVVDGTSPDPVYDWRAIQLELELFDPELSSKRAVIAYNKVDVPDSADYYEDVRELMLAEGIPSEDIFDISAVSGHGVLAVVRRVREILDSMPASESEPRMMTDAVNMTAKPSHNFHKSRIDDFTIDRDGSQGVVVWYVEGEAIERFAQMTSWDYFEGVSRFQKALEACGVNKKLRAQGIREGETVCIGSLEYAWNDYTSEGDMFDAWARERKLAGKTIQGSVHWPKRG